MQNIYQIQSGQLTPFINAFNNIGVPILPLLNKVGLSSKVIEEPSTMIPEYAVWNAINQVSLNEEIPLLGCFVANLEQQQSNFAQLGEEVENEMNLFMSLRCLIDNLLQYANFQNYWLEEDSNYIKLCRKGTPGITVGKWQVEQYVMSYFINLIQKHLGKNWHPSYLSLQTNIPHQAKLCFPDTTIFYNQPYGVVAIEKHNFTDTKTSTYKKVKQNTINSSPINQVLYSLLKDGVFANHSDIKSVSLAMGVHERKIQRILKSENTSFRDLRNKVFIESACDLLIDQELTIKEISQKLGYNNANNFSRAFKASTGLSAIEYRKYKQR